MKDVREMTFREVVAKNPLTSSIVWSRRVAAGAHTIFNVRAIANVHGGLLVLTALVCCAQFEYRVETSDSIRVRIA